MAKNNQEVTFVRDHLETKLVRAGFAPDKAADMVKLVSDDEIKKRLPKAKMTGPRDVLRWIIANRERILEIVEDLASILTLFGEKTQASNPVANKKPVAAEDDEVEEEEADEEDTQ